jgi:hypothetical protein
MQPTPPKGRLQDAGAAQTLHILALGNKAIPMLIDCLTDETRTKEPIEDYWPVTTVGDICILLPMRFVHGLNVGAFNHRWCGQLGEIEGRIPELTSIDGLVRIC